MKKALIVFAFLPALFGRSQTAPVVLDLDQANLSADIRINCARFMSNEQIGWSGYGCSIHVIDMKMLSETKLGDASEPMDMFRVAGDSCTVVATTPGGQFLSWNFCDEKLKYVAGEFIKEYAQTHVISFSPDGRTYFVNGFGCEIKQRSITNGKVMKKLKPIQEECIYMAVCNPVTGQIYCGGNSSVWEAKKGEKSGLLNDELSVINSIAVSPDGKTVAVCGREGIALLDANLKNPRMLVKGEDWWNELIFSPDGKYLYSCSGALDYKNAVTIWDLANEKELISFTDFSGGVNTIDLSPNGRYLLAASLDGSLRIFSTVDQRQVLAAFPVFIGESLEYIFQMANGAVYTSDRMWGIAEIRSKGVVRTKDNNASVIREQINALFRD